MYVYVHRSYKECRSSAAIELMETITYFEADMVTDHLLELSGSLRGSAWNQCSQNRLSEEKLPIQGRFWVTFSTCIVCTQCRYTV